MKEEKKNSIQYHIHDKLRLKYANGTHISIDTSDILTTLLDLVCLIFENRSLCTDRLVAPLLILTSSHPLLSNFSPVESAELPMFLSHLY